MCTRKRTIIWKDASIQLIRTVYARGCKQHVDFYSYKLNDGTLLRMLIASCGSMSSLEALGFERRKNIITKRSYAD